MTVDGLAAKFNWQMTTFDKHVQRVFTQQQVDLATE